MSVKFRLIRKKNLGKDRDTIPEKTYAQPVYSDLVSFEEILQDIVGPGMPARRVEKLVDCIVRLIQENLAAGHRVQFGELGNFRYGVSSVGCVSCDDFDPSLLKTPKVIFSPGSFLRKAKKCVEFTKCNLPGTSVIENSESDEPSDAL